MYAEDANFWPVNTLIRVMQNTQIPVRIRVTCCEKVAGPHSCSYVGPTYRLDNSPPTMMASYSNSGGKLHGPLRESMYLALLF